jgi:hypothetical protein
MTKVMQMAARTLTVLGIVLVMFAGANAQTAKAQTGTTLPPDGWLDPCVVNPLNGTCSLGNICPIFKFCKRGNANNIIFPILDANGVPTCCW